MAEKMSTLVLKVDIDCSKCYNKVRRTLCQFHYEIRSQTIDKKAGTFTISGPFDPESFAKKLSSKAGKAIKGIDIKKKEEEKPKDAPKKADPKPADKPKQADPKPADKPKQAEKPKEDKPADKPKEDKAADKPAKQVTIAEGPPKSADPPKAAPQPGPEMKLVEPGTVLAYPIIQPYGAYSMPCYEGYMNGGPVYDGYGRAVPVGYNNGYGDNRVVYGNGGGYTGNSNHNNYEGEYFTEKDPNCSIM